MTFEPKSVKTADTISMTAVVLIYILCIAALGAVGYGIYRRKGKAEKEPKEAK